MVVDQDWKDGGDGLDRIVCHIACAMQWRHGRDDARGHRWQQFDRSRKRNCRPIDDDVADDDVAHDADGDAAAADAAASFANAVHAGTIQPSPVHAVAIQPDAGTAASTSIRPASGGCGKEEGGCGSENCQSETEVEGR